MLKEPIFLLLFKSSEVFILEAALIAFFVHLFVIDFPEGMCMYVQRWFMW